MEVRRKPVAMSHLGGEDPEPRRPPVGAGVRGFFGRVSRNRRQLGAVFASHYAAILERRVAGRVRSGTSKRHRHSVRSERCDRSWIRDRRHRLGRTTEGGQIKSNRFVALISGRPGQTGHRGRARLRTLGQPAPESKDRSSRTRFESDPNSSPEGRGGRNSASPGNVSRGEVRR